jgi:hypothetical protein
MPRSARAALALALVACGCRSSLDMSARDVARLREDEGRIVGSVLIVTEHAAGAAPEVRSSGGPTAEGSYSLLARRGSFLGDDGHAITVLPGEERAFVARLPEGDYTFYEVKQTFTRLRAEIDAQFTVREGRTTYIGRLELWLPERMQQGMPSGVRCLDAKERDLELLGPEVRALVGELETRLVTLPAARRSLPR